MKRWTTEKYKKELVKMGIIDIIQLEDYVVSQYKIQHKCLVCNEEFLKSPNEVFEYKKRGIEICPKCSGRKLEKGVNTLWDTHPEIASMLLNPEDGYVNRYTSETKVDWICPECGEIIRQKSIHNTVSSALVCPLCGNTRSKGHRIVNAILSQLGIEYVNEKSFYWSDRKSYDVYIDCISCIIEIHGIQHYEYCDLLKRSGKTLEDEQANDKYKKDIAKQNNISHYIEIEAKVSDYNYIINSVKNNKDFNSLFDLTYIKWDEVLNAMATSNVLKICDLYNEGKSVSEIKDVLHMSDTVIQRHLNNFKSVGLCNYKGLAEKDKPVICITTGERFQNLKEAGQKYHINGNGISFVCRGIRNRKYAGKLCDGTKLQWLFEDDYTRKSKKEIDELLNINYKKPTGYPSKVICLNTLEVFDMIKTASEKYGAKSISDCCRHIGKSSGLHPTTGEKLKWLYYDEYKTLMNEQINEILDDIDYDDKRVVCVNTGEVFENATIAGEWCKVGTSGICNVISGNHMTNGKHPETGESLMWLKYRDYININNNINESDCEKSVAFSM
jgi:predicted RNA-binding Zn-ribbon protein involved in translation (DUF1610 family)